MKVILIFIFFVGYCASSLAGGNFHIRNCTTEGPKQSHTCQYNSSGGASYQATALKSCDWGYTCEFLEKNSGLGRCSFHFVGAELIDGKLYTKFDAGRDGCKYSLKSQLDKHIKKTCRNPGIEVGTKAEMFKSAKACF